MHLKSNIAPQLPICKMLCDEPLDPKLNMYEVTSYMNTHSATLFIGRPGSGKTSLLYSFFKSNKLFKNVFHTIYLFQPARSRDSMNDKIFSVLPPNQVFEELNIENLTYVIDNIKITSLEYNSVIIFDDMTAYLKQSHLIETKLKDLVFNRRHIRTSIFFLCQSYISVPKEIRKMFNNLFIFKVSKLEAEEIFEELVEIEKKKVLSICEIAFNKKFNFLFIHTLNRKMYRNFDEIIIDGDNIQDV